MPVISQKFYHTAAPSLMKLLQYKYFSELASIIILSQIS